MPGLVTSWATGRRREVAAIQDAALRRPLAEEARETRLDRLGMGSWWLSVREPPMNYYNWLKRSETMATRIEVYDAIDTERDYQDRHWPEDQTLGESILLLEEYTARARAIWAGEKKPETEALNMVRKVAGIAVHAMEQHGAPKREFFKP